MVTKLNFNLKKAILFNKTKILYDSSLEPIDQLIVAYKDTSKNSNQKFLKLQPLLYPTLSLFNYLFVDGFIQRQISKYIKKYYKNGQIFLEIGCGDFSIASYIPEDTFYNGFDITFTKYYLDRLISNRLNSNVVLASVLDIPLNDNSVDFIVCSEVFYEVPNVNIAFKEISRILKPGGLLIVTNPNSYCYKYKKKGDHSLVKNKWSFIEFPKILTTYNFDLIESKMLGYWLPVTRKFVSLSIQLPLSSKLEELNTNFFYVFKKNK